MLVRNCLYIERFPRRSTDVPDVIQSHFDSHDDKITLEEVLSPIKDKTEDETQKKEEKNFVRPRFVKVPALSVLSGCDLITF